MAVRLSSGIGKAVPWMYRGVLRSWSTIWKGTEDGAGSGVGPMLVRNYSPSVMGRGLLVSGQTRLNRGAMSFRSDGVGARRAYGKGLFGIDVDKLKEMAEGAKDQFSVGLDDDTNSTEEEESDEKISTEIAGLDAHVGTMFLDRPDKLNALSEKMGYCIEHAVEGIQETYPNLRCLVLTGRGRAFSAGGDMDFLRERAERTPEQNSRDMMNYYRLFLSLRSLKIPIIAAINGPAVGAGLCLALACDIRIASSNAKMGVNFAKLGIHGGMASTHFLPKLIGHQQASRLLLTGELIDAEEAENIGLVLSVHEEDKLMKEAFRLAKQIAAASPIAVRSMTQTLRNKTNIGLEQALQREADAQAHCYAAGGDLEEGLDAVMNKRNPKFKDEIFSFDSFMKDNDAE